jgi:hypothetical protein
MASDKGGEIKIRYMFQAHSQYVVQSDLICNRVISPILDRNSLDLSTISVGDLNIGKVALNTSRAISRRGRATGGSDLIAVFHVDVSIPRFTFINHTQLY